MVYGDHIAITSGNKSTTRREDFCRGMLLAPWIDITHRNADDTYRRTGPDSGNAARASRLRVARAPLPDASPQFTNVLLAENVPSSAVAPYALRVTRPAGIVI